LYETGWNWGLFFRFNSAIFQLSTALAGAIFFKAREAVETANLSQPLPKQPKLLDRVRSALRVRHYHEVVTLSQPAHGRSLCPLDQIELLKNENGYISEQQKSCFT
jgi:hypothetical protein